MSKTDALLTGSANVAWNVFQAFNSHIKENDSPQPGWAPGPFPKSRECTKPPFGFPRKTDSLCPKCVIELREIVINGKISIHDLIKGHYREIKAPHTVEKLKKAGVKLMFLGIESPQKRVLKSYRKGGKSSAEISEQAVNLLRENGIETWGAFMMGEPMETEEDIKGTIDYAKYLNPGVAQFSILTPFPATEIWQEYQSRIFTKDWNKYDCMHSVIRNDNIESKTLEEICRKAYVNYYLQPKRLIREFFSKNHNGRPDLKMIKQVVKAARTVFKENPVENTMATEVRQLVY